MTWRGGASYVMDRQGAVCLGTAGGSRQGLELRVKLWSGRQAPVRYGKAWMGQDRLGMAAKVRLVKDRFGQVRYVLAGKVRSVRERCGQGGIGKERKEH